MSIEEDRKRLSQDSMLQLLRRDVPITEMIPVDLYDSNEPHRYVIFCALIPSVRIDESLANLGWDLCPGDDYPRAIQYSEDGATLTKYSRFGDERGIEPLVILRDFHGLRPDYHEISEEFRLFHRLYHDRTLDQYIKFDDSGGEHLIATIEPNRVQIRLKELRQFLAVKDMHLAIYYSFRELSLYSLEEFVPERGGTKHGEGLLGWGLYYSAPSDILYRAQSVLLAKLLIPPLPKDKIGLPGFANQASEKYVDYIIGVDQDGDEITHTSDPDTLANYFGANPDAPFFLTAVHFSKQVLDKYYQQPGKYQISTGTLACADLWRLDIDNHHEDRVCVCLADLGSLSYEEQIYWRSYNIPPVGGISDTFLRRQIHGEFADSDRVEHIFQRRYRDLSKACEEHLGWQLLLPLAKEDEHHFQCIRIPSTDEQRDFDELVLDLTKILIDSLNEKGLAGFVAPQKVTELKGSVSKLEAALAAKGASGFEEHIKFLRRLQNLRSAGSAHRKGSNYQKSAREFGVDNQSLRGVFSGILRQALEALDYFVGVIRSGKLGSVDASEGEVDDS